MKASDLDFNVRMHDLRHARASWLLAGGADLKGVMERMGHAQIQTTQKYLHTLPDTDQKNLDAFTRVGGRRSKAPGKAKSGTQLVPGGYGLSRADRGVVDLANLGEGHSWMRCGLQPVGSGLRPTPR